MRKGEREGGEDIAWLVSDSGMEEMRGVRTVDIPAIHPRLKVGHHTHSPESKVHLKVTIVISF